MWRSAFLRNNDIHPDHVIEMAVHIKKEHNSLMNISSKAVMEGRIEFGSLKGLWGRIRGDDKSDKKKVMKGGRMSEPAGPSGPRGASVREEEDEEEEEDVWLTNLTSQGKPYYYNKKTRETTWTLPEGAVLADAICAPGDIPRADGGGLVAWL